MLANAFEAESPLTHSATITSVPVSLHETAATETMSADPSAAHSTKNVEAEDLPLVRCDRSGWAQRQDKYARWL